MNALKKITTPIILLGGVSLYSLIITAIITEYQGRIEILIKGGGITIIIDKTQQSTIKLP